MDNIEQHFMSISNENGKAFLKVSKTDLEESINGLNCLLPILKPLVIQGNGNNRLQAILDVQELENHFNTAIAAMTMVLANGINNSISEDKP